MLITAEGATPETQAAVTHTAQNPTVTVNTPLPQQPQNSNQGATPPIQIDTANRIATLENERDSGNARIRELNAENKKYRLLSDSVTKMGIEPDELKARLAALETYEKLGKADELATKFATLETEAAQGRKLRVEAIATNAGYKSILADFAERNGFSVATRDGKDKDGNAIKEPIAITQGADGKPVETVLGEFLKTNYVDYLPALEKAPQQSATRGASPTPDFADSGDGARIEREKQGQLATMTVTRGAF